jgi:hypothetical protein
MFEARSAEFELVYRRTLPAGALVLAGATAVYLLLR